MFLYQLNIWLMIYFFCLVKNTGEGNLKIYNKLQYLLKMAETHSSILKVNVKAIGFSATKQQLNTKVAISKRPKKYTH